MTRIFLHLLGLCLILTCLNTNTFAAPETLNVRDFGATGDGTTDDAPAFQKALDALATAGGGTLFVPEGKYVIATPVNKNFTGLAQSITIMGVESLTMPAPPTAAGDQLCLGLNLPTEIYPRTGVKNVAFTISGLKNLVIKDIAFVGTPDVATDAAITLFLIEIDKAQLRHNEFYGLATFADGGAIVAAVRCDLEISLSKFLGSTATSGGYLPLVQNLEWYGITVTDTTFLDYGTRELFGKTGLAAPISWINIGNAAPPTNVSPRREVVLRNVFMDEGGFWGLSSLPYRYTPQSAPIDLIYVTGLVMNVSNFDQFGHQLYDARQVFIEKSRYGYSQNASAAIALRNIGTAILDQLTCIADADHIFADADTGQVTVINSTYAQLDSSAHKTTTINTPEDPVQYVRARFTDALGREPDPAAHFYWSNLLINCSNDVACTEGAKKALDDYLSTSPAPTFTFSGRITDDDGVALAGTTVTLSGSQSVTTTTDANGNYFFSNLPTSGEYVITAAKNGYTFNPAGMRFVAPTGNRTADIQPAKLTLLTMPDSDRALALELTQFLDGPFPLTTTLLSEGRNTTRIMLFGTYLGLLPGDDVDVVTAEAEDAAHTKYPLRVEFVRPLPELADVSQVVLRLNRELDDVEVFVTVTVHGRTSNKVRIAIRH
ncbi:MAG TPA: glycosyl hydrolase family 28-related protein [Pyrinomonadaceae bacterium]|nr:glycosyl hydrolase family 28-related protein [Pyrinomonadaceae bacterium]